ncbi:MAG: lectin, partial [Pseudomonadota bacterium]
MMNFFVSSDTSTTANLGGLVGADMRCQTLAMAAGQGAKTWKAYLSAATPPTNAIDRIGPGPYYNFQGTMVAADKAALHARGGDAALFLTEKGARVNGQWTDSPTPNQHDILTGTLRNGMLAATF